MVARTKIAAVLTLNMAQGMPASFFAIGLPALLRDSGATLDVVAMSYLIWAPWALKWLWGSSLDKGGSFLGKIGQGIVWLPPLIAVCFLLLLPFPPSFATWPLFAAGLICSFLSATLQMSLSRWIVLTEKDEKQRAVLNSVQVIGMTSGAMIGGALVVFLAAWMSWAIAVCSISILISAAALPFLLVEEKSPMDANRHQFDDGCTLLSSVQLLLRRPGVVHLLVLMLFSDLATGADVLLPAFLIDAGYDATTVTFLLATCAMTIIVVAGLPTGALLRSLGAERVLVILLMTKTILLLVLSLLSLEQKELAAILAVFSVVVTALSAVAYLQLYMRAASSETAASDIAVLTSIRAVYLMTGALGGGYIASRVSYFEMFASAAVLSLVAAVMVLRLASSDKDIRKAV